MIAMHAPPAMLPKPTNIGSRAPDNRDRISEKFSQILHTKERSQSVATDDLSPTNSLNNDLLIAIGRECLERPMLQWPASKIAASAHNQALPTTSQPLPSLTPLGPLEGNGNTSSDHPCATGLLEHVQSFQTLGILHDRGVVIADTIEDGHDNPSTDGRLSSLPLGPNAVSSEYQASAQHHRSTSADQTAGHNAAYPLGGGSSATTSFLSSAMPRAELTVGIYMPFVTNSRYGLAQVPYSQPISAMTEASISVLDVIIPEAHDRPITLQLKTHAGTETTRAQSISNRAKASIRNLGSQNTMCVNTVRDDDVINVTIAAPHDGTGDTHLAKQVTRLVARYGLVLGRVSISGRDLNARETSGDDVWQ